MSADGNAVVVHCGACGHAWPLAFLPMSVETFARLAEHAACPRGCEANVYFGERVAAPEPEPAPAIPGPSRWRPRKRLTRGARP